MHFILDGKLAKQEPDLIAWAHWYNTADAEHQRQVVETLLPGDVRVSTVFTGINHNYLQPDNPILFETMVFGGPYDLAMWRWHTWKEAETGHDDIVRIVQEGE